jgi:hypothetical protein
MSPRRRWWAAVLVGLVALAAAGAAIVLRMMNAAMFEPGTVAARVAQQGESLDPGAVLPRARLRPARLRAINASVHGGAGR